MAKLLAENPRTDDWHVVDRPVLRTVCPQVAALNGKIARTRRRTGLRGDIGKLTDAIPASVGTSDPASAALSAYLAALLGVRLPASAAIAFACAGARPRAGRRAGRGAAGGDRSEGT